ncbi:MAG: 3-phosphoshikimate 1-carboxyvinyltransferase [spirochete symbiont of Stewartia floridana]|nr:MAG: 3-phosphoshikimate 1-carboxyvinyltransferase [spirochete symbiont of Stewartia floridana]
MTKTIAGRPPRSSARRVTGRVAPPASKSHTIRALLIAAFAEGKSRLRSPLKSADTLSCRNAVQALGAEVTEDGENWIVDGFSGMPKACGGCIDVGNSGTTLFLSAALTALSSKGFSFDGDSQLRRRSAAPLLDALRQMGAEAESSTEGCAPFTLRGPLTPGRVSVECPVSQYLSGLLLAAPLIRSPGETCIEVQGLNEAPYVGITLDWLDFQDIIYNREEWRLFRVPSGQRYRHFDRLIPGDWSSATFFLAAAAVTGGSLVLDGLDIGDSQGDKAVLDMLKTMGCRWDALPGGVRIEGGQLAGCELDLNATPDALPAMAAAACFAEGETRLVNVPQARLKETDRIAVISAELGKLGADITELPDGLVIRGTPGSPLRGALVDSHADHRVAMALAIAALGCVGSTSITGADAVNITFPGFFDLLETVLEA